MSAVPAPKGVTPHSIVPLPPTASILQKQSSFLRPKDGSAASPSRVGSAHSIGNGSSGSTATAAAGAQQPTSNTSHALPTSNGAATTGASNRNGNGTGTANTASGHAAGVPERRSSIVPAGAGRPVAAASGAGASVAQATPVANRPPEPPGMWGPRNELKPHVPPTGAVNATNAVMAVTPAGTMPGAAQPNGATGAGPGSAPANYGAPMMAGGVVSAQNNVVGSQFGSAYGSMSGMSTMPATAAAPSAARLGSAYGMMGTVPSRHNSGGYGSMGPSMLPGSNSGGVPSVGSGVAFGSAAPQPGSMFAAAAVAAAPSQAAGSAYGLMGMGSSINNTSTAMPGSMYGGMSSYNAAASGAGSFYGAHMPGSMYGAGSNRGSVQQMGGGSMYGNMPGSMYGGMFGVAGSMYNMPRATSGYGFSAQWGSLANMSSYGGGAAGQGGRGSAYGSLNDSDKRLTMTDICPVLGDYKDAPELQRSGRRGGNHLYAHDKRDKTAPKTSNSQSVLMTIKRRKLNKGGAAEDSDKSGESSSSGGGGTTQTASATHTAPRVSPRNVSANDKPRAKVPANYNVHTLLVIDTSSDTSRNNSSSSSASTAAATVTVQDPNTVVYEKAGKKDKFDCDEALEYGDTDTQLDSVLLSELRGNWLSGHNSSLLVGAARGQTKLATRHAVEFIEKCVSRVSSETDTAAGFDVSVTMAALRGAELCRDVLKKGSDFEKAKLGSSPVYGPCMLGLTTECVHSAKECVQVLQKGLDETKTETEVVVAFLVLKRYKGTGSEKDVHLGSLCLAFLHEQVSLLRDVKEKLSSAPHKLLRYAVGGASLTVSMLCIAQSDADARASLEVERQMREVKNSAPRSGNVKRFIEYTEKELARQKEKMQSSSESEKKTREALVKRMEDMIADAQTMLKKPSDTAPKGYPLS